MISTFTQILSEVQQATNNTSATELILIKRDANVATQRFKSVMSRPWSRISKKANIVASQQDYQLPKSVLRISGVEYLYSTSYYPLIEVGSEEAWNRINAIPQGSSGTPSHYFIKGKNVVSLYPEPGTAVTEGLKVYYEPKQPRMINADYTTGSVTVTNGAVAITHSATGFTNQMIGQYFYTTDGSDGYDYQIVDYTSSSVLVLENYYEGLSGAGKTFVIGAVPDIPDEYLPSIVDYCLARFELRRGDKASHRELMSVFQSAVDECKEVYSSPTSNQVIRNLGDMGFNYFDIPPMTLS